MNVTNNAGVSPGAVPPPQQSAGASPIQRDFRPPVLAPDSDAYTPSAEWLRLVDLVKQEPAVRIDRVREALQKIQNGDYFSADSAAKTAEAILQSAD